MSPEYASQYERLLETVARTPDARGNTLNSFWPMVGHRFEDELLIVGRAVNGWGEDWTAEGAGDPASRRRIVESTRALSEGDSRCPMLWVTDHKANRKPGEWNPRRSAFWRVIEKIALRGVVPPEDAGRWPSYCAWSNLYKVSPKPPRSGQGNPEGALRAVQVPLAADLLAREVEEMAPRRVLVLTGLGWFRPFADALGLAVRPWDATVGGKIYIEGVADQGGRCWVIGPHPQSRPDEPIVSQALASLGLGR
jgi:hypothetical protein